MQKYKVKKGKEPVVIVEASSLRNAVDKVLEKNELVHKAHYDDVDGEFEIYKYSKPAYVLKIWREL
jgi:hypothetical protein